MKLNRRYFNLTLFCGTGHQEVKSNNSNDISEGMESKCLYKQISRETKILEKGNFAGM